MIDGLKIRKIQWGKDRVWYFSVVDIVRVVIQKDHASIGMIL
jgi:hypothetical protein